MKQKPNREPDLKIENYWFYFKEMVQWNVCDRLTYNLRISEILGFQYFSHRDDRWIAYDLCDRDVIYENYVNWQVENILLE